MHLQHRDFQQWDKWILLLRVAMILATSGWGQVKYFSSLSCWPGIWILWTFDCNCSCHPMKRNNTCTSIYQQHVQNIDCSTHRIYLYIIWYIYLYIYHENQLNVGKYIIHWMVNAVLDLPFFSSNCCCDNSFGWPLGDFARVLEVPYCWCFRNAKANHLACMKPCK